MTGPYRQKACTCGAGERRVRVPVNWEKMARLVAVLWFVAVFVVANLGWLTPYELWHGLATMADVFVAFLVSMWALWKLGPFQ